MKKVSFLSCILCSMLLLSFISCDDENEPAKIINTDVYGSWITKYTSVLSDSLLSEVITLDETTVEFISKDSLKLWYNNDYYGTGDKFGQVTYYYEVSKGEKLILIDGEIRKEYSYTTDYKFKKYDTVVPREYVEILRKMKGKWRIIEGGNYCKKCYEQSVYYKYLVDDEIRIYDNTKFGLFHFADIENGISQRSLFEYVLEVNDNDEMIDNQLSVAYSYLGEIFDLYYPVREKDELIYSEHDFYDIYFKNDTLVMKCSKHDVELMYEKVD